MSEEIKRLAYYVEVDGTEAELVELRDSLDATIAIARDTGKIDTAGAAVIGKPDQVERFDIRRHAEQIRSSYPELMERAQAQAEEMKRLERLWGADEPPNKGT